MRTMLTSMVLALFVASAASAQETADQAPYFTSLDSALAKAGANQYVVVDFYTQW